MKLEQHALWILFSGPRDPGYRPVCGEAELAGPVLRAVREHTPRRVIVYHDASGRWERWQTLLAASCPQIDLECRDLPGIQAALQETPEAAVLVDPRDPENLVRASALGEGRRGLALFVPGPEPDHAQIPWPWILFSGPAVSPKSVEEPPGGATASVREPVAAYRTRAAPVQVRRPENREAVCRDMGLIGQHSDWLRLLEQCSTLAQHPVPVLIQGETGTGKELISQFVHRMSPRVGEPFVPVNCGALPANLIESILFGHRKGAFTGAHTDQPGKFVQAHGGTLFLDEIGELPLELQPKLLRVLENGQVEAVGARDPQVVDVRIIAASHQDLKRAVAEGRFREDLYYRLAYGVLHIPALRERGDDIVLLAEQMLRRFNRSLTEPRKLGASALSALLAHPWPGNVRDLENVVGRSALWCPRETLEAEDLLFDSVPGGAHADAWRGLPKPEEGFSLEAFLAGARRRLIQTALAQADGNQSAAARLLGITPQAVHRFVREEGTG